MARQTLSMLRNDLELAQLAADREAARLFAGEVKTARSANRAARALEEAQASYDLALSDTRTEHTS